MDNENQQRISFKLEQDENGYPPDKWEVLWASESGDGLYCVDNIPFFVYGISGGDLISASGEGDRLVFRELVSASSNTVFRLYLSNADEMQPVRDSLRALGCESELSHLPKLVAVEVPAEVKFEPIADFLEKGEENGRWRYDEGVFRHPIPA